MTDPTSPSPVALDPALRAAWKTLLGRLINKGARLRFFPHRVMMFLSLASTVGPEERPEFLQSATETFREWQRLARGIGGEHRLIDVPPGLSPVLVDQMATGISRYRTICKRFDTEAERLLADSANIDQLGDRIIALSRFVATDMLVCMNELVASFEAELADTAERTEDMVQEANRARRATEVTSSTARQLTEELGRVNGRVQLISLNALIEAARAGENGATFGTVAQEIKALSGEIGSLTERIRAELAER